LKGKINIYDNQGNIVLSIQAIITVAKHENGYITITYLDDNKVNKTIQTNMSYIYWQD